MAQGDKIVAGLTAIIAQGVFWGMMGAFAVRGVIRWALSAFQLIQRKRN